MPKPTDAKKVLEMLYGAPKPAVSRLDMNFKDVTKRMPELQQAAKLYEQGKITREQYYAIVDQLKPVTPYEFIPKPATAEEALAALSKDKTKDFGRTDVLTPGETILSRLDIPAYSKKGTWVTSQHRLKPPADEPKTIYTPTMMLEGETKMMPGTGAARRVAKGEKQKSSFATIRGAYKPGSDEEAVERAIEALRSKDYAQIGYDPERRGFFYDRRTMEPIIGTEEGIIQIGPLVLGKKPIRGNPEDFEYKEGGAVHMQDGGDPTQMFNFNPMAAKAAKQKQMRESTPETPLGALTKGFGTGLFGSTEEQVPYSGSIMEGSPQRQQSQANLREIGRNIGALTDIGGMVTPFAKPAAQAITRGASALGRTGLEQVDRAMFGEGPLASLVAPVAPLQAVPRVQAPVSRLGFYDPVEQAGLNIQRKQGPGQAFLNELQRSENVSKDFLEASGIAEKLRTAPNITREEVQALTKGAVPQVEQVVLGSNFVSPHLNEFAKVHLPDFNPNDKESINKLIQIADQRYQKAMADGDLDLAEFAEQAESDAKSLANQYAKGDKPVDRLAKYAEYQIPGGKNYREVLLTIPSKRPSIKNMSRAEYNAAVEEADRLGIQNYQSSHWDEPNVVSHIRMNDRTDFNGKKVLFIEEMQSDWAQQGRKRGFADKPLTRDDLVATVNNSADRPYWEVRTKDGHFIANTGLGDKEISAQEAVDEALQLVKTRGDKRIPTGPFVKNTNEWVDLSLKNILKRAVDEGYDRVAFINGKQSADRYDLANYVDSIQWDNNVSKFSFGKSNIDKTVEINLQNGERIRLPITSDGKVVNSRDSRFDGKNLDDIIGKDVAKKIVAGEAGTLEGEGLSIGGEGMKKFYDQIVPDRLRKLVGKDNVKHIPGAVRHYGDADDYEIRVNRGGNSYYLYNTVTGDSLDESFNNLSDAHNFLEKLNKRNPALPQLGFDITPEIREKFSKPIPYKKGGAVRISDNPDTMLLELMNAPKMQAGGAALKAFRDKLLAQHQRSLAKDPHFKQAPGEVTNLAGKSYAQWAAEQQYKHDLEDALARLSGVPGKKMSIQDLPVGSRLLSIVGDRTQADKILRSVNETPLANEVILHGGPRFGQGKLAEGKEDFWASNASQAKAVQNRVDAAAERAKGKPVIGVYTAMGASDSDMYAKHFAESLIEQYPFTGMTGKQVDAFNKEFRKKYPQFAGVDKPEFVDQIMSDSKMRKAFVDEHLKKKNIEKFNIPDGLATRHAITVPELRDVPTGLAGYSVGEMKPGMALEKGSYLEHPSYDTAIPGKFMGGLELMQDFRDLFPDATQRMLQTLRNNPKFQGPDARKPESQLFGTFGMQGAEQEVTQKLIDELAAREELIKQLGILPYKKGGKVKKVKISNNPDAMQLELMRKKKHA